MLIHVHHAADGDNGPDRLAFSFRPAAWRRKMGLAGDRLLEGEASGPEPAGAPPTVRRVPAGERRFARLGPDRGDRFAFWLPGVGAPDPAIVISPLNSLVRAASMALAVQTADNGNHPLSDLKLGRLRLLYVPPEALAVRGFREALAAALGDARPGALVIDEAHAVSEWRPGFRPAYRRIPQLVDDLSRKSADLTVLALTAAADRAVGRDAAARLGMTDRTPPRRTDLHRPGLSLQLVTAEGTAAKTEAGRRALAGPVADLFRREGWAAPDPAAVPFPDEAEPGADGGPTADRFSVTTREPAGPSGDARVAIQSGLGDGLARRLWRMLRVDPPNGRVHRLWLVDPPAADCAADLLARADRVPRCRDDRCAFGRPALCDYGREHHRIQRAMPDLAAETLTALDVLDDLLTGVEAGEAPIPIPVRAAGVAAAERALHRLEDMGLLTGSFRTSADGRAAFQVYGFAPPETGAPVWEGLLRHLREHDRSSTGRLRRLTPAALEAAETNRPDPAAKALRDRVRRAVREGRFGHYDARRPLFDALAAALPRRIAHVANFRRRQAYHRLWNLKTVLFRRNCRYAGLLWAVAATDEGWRCEACDRCAPDLHFDTARRRPPTGVPGLPELETDFMAWLTDPEIPFAAAEADDKLQRFGDAFENIAARAAGTLEVSPRNLKALYMAREFARPEERPLAERDLMRVARRDLSPLRIIRLCDTTPAPEPARRARFELLDDEAGGLATPDGERWLYTEALSLSLDPERLALLGGRVTVNALARVDLSPHLDRLDRLLKEIDHGPAVQP